MIEIVREYVTKDKQKLTFTVKENIPEIEGSAWIVHKITAYLGNEEVGYIKVSYIPKGKFNYYFPNIIYYLGQVQGLVYFPSRNKVYQVEKLADEELQYLVHSI